MAEVVHRCIQVIDGALWQWDLGRSVEVTPPH